MQLEDHIGDICRKSRIQSGVNIQDAAYASGLSEENLQRWEDQGEIETPVNVQALAVLLGLDPEKSMSIAEGWVPRDVNLNQWSKLNVLTTVQGFEVNSYVIWDPDTRETAIFDTGWFADDIFSLVETERLNIQYLFITHMHGDHVAALSEIRKRFPQIQVLSNNDGAPPKNRIKTDRSIDLGRLKVGARLTPGHAEDGVTFVVEGWGQDIPPVAIPGDAIFAGSMGKDFFTPDIARLKVREEILTLPANTLICPGHGPLTTVSEELEHNPFF
tara:strand:- start:1834 stop:2652 length:819 start_codon:yes stop_codon:yes gene_type:complete